MMSAYAVEVGARRYPFRVFGYRLATTTPTKEPSPPVLSLSSVFTQHVSLASICCLSVTYLYACKSSLLHLGRRAYRFRVHRLPQIPEMKCSRTPAILL